MNVGFPPIPAFPLGLDSDQTLFQVYNTAEAQTTADNDSNSDTISIIPVAANAPEQWAANGFANISGELFYYDAVSYDGNGKVNTLKRCARNLGGTDSQFNPQGTWVRGFVVAEHHNQLVTALILLEQYLGIACTNPTTCDPNATITCKIQRMVDEPNCADDNNCPAVNFDFSVPSTTDPCQGVTATFSVGIAGTFTSYNLSFGDGQFTTTDFQGTHTYSPNANIDPVLTIANNSCQIVLTPSNRIQQAQPEAAVSAGPFTIPLPTLPDFPILSIPTFDPPSQTLELPQFIGPCVDTNVLVPSQISFFPPIPNVISIAGLPLTPISVLGPTLTPISMQIPSLSPIQMLGPSLSPIIMQAPTFSPIILATPTLAPIVLIGPTYSPIIILGPSYSPISIVGPSISPISLKVPSCISLCTNSISVSVNWGTPPTVSCVVNVVCPTSGTPLMAPMETPFVAPEPENQEFYDDFGNSIPLNIEVSDIGIPHEIKIVPPEMPDLRLVHDLPEKITVEAPHIPENITITGPNIPAEIVINADKLPESIALVHDLPKSIKLDTSDLPPAIKLELPKDFPTKFELDIPDKAIQVTGFPDHIELVGPSEITLKVPENIEIPLVYKGAPVPIQIDLTPITDGTDNGPCFRFVPCSPK